MGQIVNVVERPSSRPGIVRFETNRVLSGMGHDRFVAGQRIEGDRPVDELARRLFARGGLASVHIYGGIVTVDLQKGYTSAGLAELIRGLYTFYETSPTARPDAVAAEAAVAAAPDPDRAADAPVLQDLAAAQSGGVAPLPTPGDEAAARNEAIVSAAEAAAPAEADPPAEAEPAGAEATAPAEAAEAEPDAAAEAAAPAPAEAEPAGAEPAPVEHPPADMAQRAAAMNAERGTGDPLPDTPATPADVDAPEADPPQPSGRTELPG